MNYGKQVANLLLVIGSSKSSFEEVDRAHNRLREIRYAVTKKEYGVPDDRVDDIMQLEDIINDPSTPEIYKSRARHTIKIIVNETPIIRSMRKRLVKEMQSGRVDNIKDITDDAMKHKHLRNE